MIKQSKDLSGRKYGKLTVIEKAPFKEGRSTKNSVWICNCDCGKSIQVTRCNLIQFHTRSCGCLISLEEENYLIEQEKRFFKFVEKTESCWIWKGSTDKRGYGAFNYRSKDIKAHRYSFSRFKHPIPTGIFICHTCDNPSCVNPEHLYIGTHKDNMRDIRNRQTWGEKRNRISEKRKRAALILISNKIPYREIAELLNISAGQVMKYAKT